MILNKENQNVIFFKVSYFIFTFVFLLFLTINRIEKQIKELF